jgi:hypothetical protein
MGVTKKHPGAAGLGGRSTPTIGLVDVALTRRTDHPRFGSISRYSVTTDDGMEREVIHGRSSATKPGSPFHLTIGTAPPLSLGPEGVVMHFLMKAMESGLDGIVFGPERSHPDITDDDQMRQLASTLTFGSTAHVSHLVCDHLAETTSADLGHMLWTGVSLGAMKGIAFSAAAPSAGRRMVYSHFVVPVCPYPIDPPSDEDLKRFNRSELGAMVRLSSELLAHDMRSRVFRLNQNVARALRPGLMVRYARSIPRDSVSNIFTAGWRDAVVSGDAGVAASTLPTESLATFELFDLDEGYTTEDWTRRLGDRLGDRVRIIERHGRHTDALRLSHQNDRGRHLGRLLREVRAGVPLDELAHPYASETSD